MFNTKWQGIYRVDWIPTGLGWRFWFKYQYKPFGWVIYLEAELMNKHLTQIANCRLVGSVQLKVGSYVGQGHLSLHG